nr:MAG TPA: hypothetical protein [Caudoviricetes sp.]
MRFAISDFMKLTPKNKRLFWRFSEFENILVYQYVSIFFQKINSEKLFLALHMR